MLIFDNIFNKLKLTDKKIIGNVAEGIKDDDVATVSQLGNITPTDWTLYEIQQADITPTSGTFTLSVVDTSYCLYKIDGNVVYIKVALFGTAASTLNAITVVLPAAINVGGSGGLFVSSAAVLVVAGTYQAAEMFMQVNELIITKISGNFPDTDLYIYYNDFNEQTI